MAGAVMNRRRHDGFGTLVALCFVFALGNFSYEWLFGTADYAKAYEHTFFELAGAFVFWCWIMFPR
jgi:hypothetical protein